MRLLRPDVEPQAIAEQLQREAELRQMTDGHNLVDSHTGFANTGERAAYASALTAITSGEIGNVVQTAPRNDRGCTADGAQYRALVWYSIKSHPLAVSRAK